MLLNIRFILLILLLVTGCGKEMPNHHFNSVAWQADPLACKNHRLALLPELEKLRPKLNGLAGKQMHELFGKPEATAIADQSEKVFYYYLEPGSQCKQTNQFSEANKLWIRVNAMQIVKETGYDRPIPKL